MLTPRHVLAALTALAAPAVALAVLGSASLASAAPPPKPASVSLGDGGAVVSLSSGTLYLMDPKGGIVAVELATNKTKWSAGALAAKPFAEVGDALIGADDKGAIRVLHAKTGKLYGKCSTIPGLTIQLQDGLGSNHSSSGISDGKRAWISWSGSTHYAGGAAPTPEMEARARSQSGGVFEIDIATCSGKPGTNPYAPGEAVGGAPELTTPSGITFRVTSGALRLERRRGKTALPPIDLKQGKQDRSMFEVTADLRHVIASASSGSAYPSAIFDVETGAVVASVTLPLFPPGSVLVGRQLVMGGGAVWVFDLDKQAVRWSRGLRSTQYNGPYPPSAPPSGGRGGPERPE